MFRSRPTINFEPPSDFVEEDSGGGTSKKKTLLKVTGFGCLGFLILFAILTAAGAFKAVSCCGDVVKQGQKSQVATMNVVLMAVNIQGQDFDTVHQSFSPELAKKMSKADLKSLFGPHRPLIAKHLPMIVETSAVIPPDKRNDLEAIKTLKRFRTHIRYYPLTPVDGSDILHMVMEVEATAPPNPEVDKKLPKVKVMSIKLQKRKLTLDKEETARMSQKIYNSLRLNGVDATYGILPLGFKESTTKAQFKAFIAQQSELFESSEYKLLNVTYFAPSKETPAFKSRVTARLTGKSGKRAIVTFEFVQKMGQYWSLTTMDQSVVTKTPAPVVEPPVVKDIPAKVEPEKKEETKTTEKTKTP